MVFSKAQKAALMLEFACWNRQKAELYLKAGLISLEDRLA
jgi:hypothetical protein